MSEDGRRIEDLERRVEQLRSANEALGRELIQARAGRRPTTAGTAGRAVARLTHGRDAALAELEASRGELELLRWENEKLRAEAQRLRSGLPGLLRRAIARALRAMSAK